MTESRLQSECFVWMWNMHPDQRCRFFHIRNEGATNIVQGTINKAVGVLSGVWDFQWIRKNNVPVFVEFKVGNNTLTKNQERFKKVIGSDAEFYVIYTFEDFRKLIEKLLK